jgi:hypothetical protein
MVPQRQGAVEGTGYVVGADWLVTNLGYREAKSLLLFRDGEEVIRTRPSPASGSCHSPLAVHGATVYAAKIAVCAILHSFVLRATNGSRMKGTREKVCARGGCGLRFVQSPHITRLKCFGDGRVPSPPGNEGLCLHPAFCPVSNSIGRAAAAY